MFSEALAELELSEREASRHREEREASEQLQETYRVGGGWWVVIRVVSSLGVCVCVCLCVCVCVCVGRLCGWTARCRAV